MMTELSMLAVSICGGFPDLNQPACQKAMEAYMVESKMDRSAAELRTYVEKTASKNVDPAILTVTGIGAKYAATKTLQYNARLPLHLTASINKTPNDFRKGIKWGFLNHFYLGTESGINQQTYTTGFNIGF